MALKESNRQYAESPSFIFTCEYKSTTQIFFGAPVKVNGEWQAPENVAAVNTVGDEGWSYVTQDGKELWFTRTYLGSPVIYRSVKVNGTRGEPELIISQFAGEPSVDGDGNIYFVHHFYTADSKMIEADTYTAQRK